MSIVRWDCFANTTASHTRCEALFIAGRKTFHFSHNTASLLKSKQNIMNRSKDYGHMHLQSSANASWGNPLSPKPSTCVDRLLLHIRQDRRQLLDESLKREKRPTPPNGALVDEIKMDQLLQSLRTNKFVGTIDPEHHSYHLSEEHESMTRQSLAHVSAKRDSSHFKALLISNQRLRKSTSGVAAHR
jgi:hypothetical protein